MLLLGTGQLNQILCHYGRPPGVFELFPGIITKYS